MIGHAGRVVGARIAKAIDYSMQIVKKPYLTKPSKNSIRKKIKTLNMDLADAILAASNWVDAAPDTEYRRFNLERSSSIIDKNSKTNPSWEVLLSSEDKQCWRTACSAFIMVREADHKTTEEVIEFIHSFLKGWAEKS